MFHHTDPKIERLARIPIFEHADGAAIRELAHVADEITVPAGTVLIKEGRLHAELFVIVAGEAVVTVGTTEVARLGDGEITGELSLFERRPANATVAAATEIDALVIPFNRMDAVMDADPTLVRAIARQLAHRLRMTDAHLRAHA